MTECPTIIARSSPVVRISSPLSRNVVQRWSWEHMIQAEADLESHFDDIHYNPVKHGFAQFIVVHGVHDLLVHLRLNVMRWVESLEFDSCIAGCESPLGALAEAVAPCLPGGEGLVHLLGALESAAHALSRQHT